MVAPCEVGILHPLAPQKRPALVPSVDDYFVKPADIASLLSTIERKLLARASLESLRKPHDL